MSRDQSGRHSPKLPCPIEAMRSPLGKPRALKNPFHIPDCLNELELTFGRSPGAIALFYREEDPFEACKFPNVLKSLTLTDVPLYKSLRGITTLTDFTLTNEEFTQSLDTILDFLEGNASLKRVGLSIGFSRPLLRSSRRKCRVRLEQLNSLSVCGSANYDAEALVSFISLPKDANLEISARPGSLHKFKNDIFLRIGDSATNTHMRMDFGGESIQLSGPNGSVRINCLSRQEMLPALTSVPLSSFKNIRKLHLVIQVTLGLPIKPSMVPALKDLIIEGDSNTPTTLSQILKSPRSFPLDRLEIRESILSTDFIEKLEGYSKHKTPLLVSVAPDVRSATITRVAPTVDMEKKASALLKFWVGNRLARHRLQ